MTKLDVLKENYKSAVTKFEEVLLEPKTSIVRDSTILRFELVFDLSWKLIKAFLEEEKGLKCVSPKECFKEAYRQTIIEYNDLWIDMVNLRNDAVHTYGEKFADIFYEKLPDTLKLFKQLQKKICD